MQILYLTLYSLSHFGYPPQSSLPCVWHFFVHSVMYASKKKCIKKEKAFLKVWFLFSLTVRALGVQLLQYK